MRSGLVMAWRLATWPTIRSPSLEKATTEGVVRLPSALGMTTASPPSMTATQELVVPKVDTNNLRHNLIPPIYQNSTLLIAFI